MLLGNGNGWFHQPPLSPLYSTNFVQVADLNGDGKPDLVIGDFGQIEILAGNGDGTFKALPPITVGANPVSAVIADVNGDGIPDIVVANEGSNSLSILFGNGDGTFQPQQTISTVASPAYVGAADLNGDGKEDLVVVGSGAAATLLGNGDGTFQPQQSYAIAAGSFWGAALADMNGDGKVDLTVAVGSNVEVLLGNGDGIFQPGIATPVGANNSLAVGDVNGDGIPDVIVSNFAYGNLRVLLGRGDGSFQPPQPFSAPRDIFAFAIADVNNDGRPDLVGASMDYSTLFPAQNGSFAGQVVAVGDPALVDSVAGTAGVDQIVLTADLDGQHIDWTLGASAGQMAVNDPNGLTINGNGANDVVTLNYANGNPLPATLHLNGTFTINGLQGTNPLAGTTLDIERSTVFLRYPNFDPITAIKGYLKAGYSGGAWNGVATASTGVITSSAAAGNPNRTTAVGYADSGDLSGTDPVPNSVELKYTLIGDANLDGQVNSTDLQILLFSLNRQVNGWDQGDFNYDGQVNSADLQAILFTLNTGLGNQATPVGQGTTTNSVAPGTGASSSTTTKTVNKQVTVSPVQPPPALHVNSSRKPEKKHR